MTPRESQPSDERRELAAKQALQLWEILLFVSVVVLFALIGITTLRRLRRRRTPQMSRNTVYRSAWEESARRLEAPDSAAINVSTFDTSPDAQTRTGQSSSFTGTRPIVFITGGAKRVGRSIVEVFARSGCDILFSYFTSEADARQLVESIRKLGVNCEAIKLDLADTERAVNSAVAYASTLPRLDILVHNASVYEASPLDTTIGVEANRQYRINALAPLMLTAALAPLLRESSLHGGGSVVCMSDIHALGNPQIGFSAYSMSKAAITEMVYALARELAPSIRVNGVAPGIVKWPEQGTFSDAAEQARYIRRVPLGRAGEPSDAANAVRWLALEATYITGEIIRVDGGRHIT